MDSPRIDRILSNRPLWRWLFWVYFAALTIALLWPNAKLPNVMPRPDLLVHYLSFGLFALLMCLHNPTGTPRQTTKVILALVVGVAYGGGTELLQSIPVLHRTAAVDDWVADSTGVGCGLLAFGALCWWRRSR